MVAPHINRIRNAGPWELFDELHRELGRFLAPETGSVSSNAGPVPALNITGDEHELVVSLEVPGFAASDLDITMEGKFLTIRGERPEPESAAEGDPSWVVRQRVGGRFERRVELPFEIEADGIVAQVENGLLQLTLPRREASKPRKIQIGG